MIKTRDNRSSNKGNLPERLLCGSKSTKNAEYVSAISRSANTYWLLAARLERQNTYSTGIAWMRWYNSTKTSTLHSRASVLTARPTFYQHASSTTFSEDWRSLSASQMLSCQNPSEPLSLLIRNKSRSIKLILGITTRHKFE